MSSLKNLNLRNNRRVTPTGWRALSGFIQSPNFALEEIDLNYNNINDDMVVAFTSSLAGNKTLKRLSLDYNRFEDDSDDEDGNLLVTDRGWLAVSSLLCNKTSILDTYNSNHILHDLGWADSRPDDLTSDFTYSELLELNGNKDKVEVARQKILQTHFNFSRDKIIQELLDMELEVMPTAIAWIGRSKPMNWTGIRTSGLSLLYNLMKRMPDLFDSGAHNKKPSAKRRKPVV